MTARRTLRVAGLLLMVAGASLLLYLVYSLLFTGVTTQRAQEQLGEQWRSSVGGVDPAAADTAADPPAAGADRRRPAPATAETSRKRDRATPRPQAGSAVAVLQFVRPGRRVAPVHDEPLYIVEGVGADDLRLGPGHYPATALPGERGNFAVAGHRTTYGAPFFHLDDLRPGDLVLVTDRSGARYTYRVRRQQIVAPSDTWVIAPNPLGSAAPTLTLTTCNPRFSASERLIVFAELTG